MALAEKLTETCYQMYKIPGTIGLSPEIVRFNQVLVGAGAGAGAGLVCGLVCRFGVPVWCAGLVCRFSVPVWCAGLVCRFGVRFGAVWCLWSQYLESASSSST
jgi:hypothetical protein